MLSNFKNTYYSLPEYRGRKPVDEGQARSPEQEARDGGNNINHKMLRRFLRGKNILTSQHFEGTKYYGRKPMDFYFTQSIRK